MSAPETTVDVLLATYNGVRFLDEQLRSLYEQTTPGVQMRLLIRDDGSQDDTPDLLAGHAARRPDVVLLRDAPGQRLGPCGSFARLLKHSQAPYAMFCDQDDVWLPDKIAVLLGRMQELEKQLGSHTPLLVHSDLAVVDESLRTRHSSFWAYRRLDPVGGSALPRLLVENVVAGCAAMLNRALVQKCLPIPAAAVMHDWWTALVAAALGRLESLPQATVLYRQHAANRIGAGRYDLAHLLGRSQAFLGPDGFRQHLRRTQQQAQALLEQLGPELSPAQRVATEAYATLAEHGCLRRRLLLVRHGFRTTGWLNNAKLLAGI